MRERGSKAVRVSPKAAPGGRAEPCPKTYPDGPTAGPRASATWEDGGRRGRRPPG